MEISRERKTKNNIIQRLMNERIDVWLIICGYLDVSDADYDMIIALLRRAGLYELEALMLYKKENPSVRVKGYRRAGYIAEGVHQPEHKQNMLATSAITLPKRQDKMPRPRKRRRR